MCFEPDARPPLPPVTGEATDDRDLTRRIWPVVMSVTDEGARRLPEPEVGAVVEAIVAERMQNPGG